MEEVRNAKLKSNENFASKLKTRNLFQSSTKNLTIDKIDYSKQNLNEIAFGGIINPNIQLKEESTGKPVFNSKLFYTTIQKLNNYYESNLNQIGLHHPSKSISHNKSRNTVFNKLTKINSDFNLQSRRTLKINNYNISLYKYIIYY